MANTTIDNFIPMSDPTTGLPAVSQRRVGGLARWFDADSLVLTYLGVLLAAVGFVLVGVAWSEVAATTNVGLQMPYLVSGGLTGLTLVMSGLLVINLAAKRRDAARRDRQTTALIDAVTQLRESIDVHQSRAND